MALINKNELYYQYSWKVLVGDDPSISGEPDSTLLNRNEGYEMLYLINKFSEKHGFRNVQSAIKVERLIKEHVPTEIRSQVDIVRWLETNWDKY